MHIFIFIFTITNLMISCADILYVEEEPTENESVVGYWFACEFGYSLPEIIISKLYTIL